MHHLCGNPISYYKLTAEKKGCSVSIDEESNGRVCFAPIVAHFYDSKTNSYSEVFKDIKMSLKMFCKNDDENSCANLCLLNEEEIILWMEELKYIYDFKYTLSLNESESFYIIDLEIPSANKPQFLWLLTGIRNMYEASNALVLKDMFRFIELGLVQPDSLINLFKVISPALRCYSSQTWFRQNFLLRLRTPNEMKSKITSLDFSQQITAIDEFEVISIEKLMYIHAEYDLDRMFKDERVIKRYSENVLPMIKIYEGNNLLPENFIYVDAKEV
jgi:hypothetical protein